ncbi:glycoside hydrolase [Lasiosphaeria miniovina]|uniref:alpha-1,2-Mannosidase n=1 Tax=Lasiosphaeria miniovina TaxID=1954250 RepID=A0AA40A0D2_9PEZI|nr:glycoside hydrolase [Lasiosphaeria miniovina]KAK0706919.1 glycoside hydrolase [Lasiosphaeria miniovina]
MARLPPGPPLRQRQVQLSFPPSAYAPHLPGTIVSASRRRVVRAAFVRCWDSYKEHAWRYDELAPVSLEGRNSFGGWAATLVDSLDTLLIMGLWDDFDAALPVVGALDFGQPSVASINVFETTIRHLGGMLSAYDLSGERVLLLKAIELGDMLYAVFDTPNRLPPFWLDFAQAKEGTQQAGTADPAAAASTLALEFTRLSQLTGNPKYFDAVDRVKAFLARTQDATQLPGMWPTLLDLAGEAADRGRDFTLGALSDSLYEYLPKMASLVGGHDPAYEAMYRSAMATVKEHLLFRPMLPDGADVLFSGDVHVRRDNGGGGVAELFAVGQHLGCFAGGMFGLGGKLFGIEEHVEIGEKLARGCAWAYKAFPTGVMPEIFGMVACPSATEGCEWDEDRWKSQAGREDQPPGLPKGFTNARDPRYLLRPEAIESVFLMYRMTGKAEYQEMAWDMFLAIQNATSTEHANSAIEDVTVERGNTTKLDNMESFWMAETLKYFYLIFSPPDLISLDEYVFNTEAHPLKRPTR